TEFPLSFISTSTAGSLGSISRHTPTPTMALLSRGSRFVQARGAPASLCWPSDGGCKSGTRTAREEAQQERAVARGGHGAVRPCRRGIRSWPDRIRVAL